MFGQSNGEDEQTISESLPPPRALTVRERNDDGEWMNTTYYGHTVQTTEAGGLNILRITVKTNMGPKGEDMLVQQMVVGLPPGQWARVSEEIDLTDSSPFAIN